MFFGSEASGERSASMPERDDELAGDTSRGEVLGIGEFGFESGELCAL
jgi:hypothetical protein